jgi:hypothetical protein
MIFLGSCLQGAFDLGPEAALGVPPVTVGRSSEYVPSGSGSVTVRRLNEAVP